MLSTFWGGPPRYFKALAIVGVSRNISYGDAIPEGGLHIYRDWPRLGKYYRDWPLIGYANPISYGPKAAITSLSL